jgi:hypothetical protein
MEGGPGYAERLKLEMYTDEVTATQRRTFSGEAAGAT